MLSDPLAHLEALGQIEFFEQIYALVQIIEFVKTEAPSSEQTSFNENSENLEEVDGLKPEFQKYTAADVLNKTTDWSRAEVDEFSKWIKSGEAQELCKSGFEEIEKAKIKLTGTVDALAYADIDPDQDEAERYRRASVVVNVLSKQGHEKKLLH